MEFLAILALLVLAVICIFALIGSAVARMSQPVAWGVWALAMLFVMAVLAGEWSKSFYKANLGAFLFCLFIGAPAVFGWLIGTFRAAASHDASQRRGEDEADSLIAPPLTASELRYPRRGIASLFPPEDTSGRSTQKSDLSVNVHLNE